METILDSQAIQELLPHRFPFLLVDRIIELVPRERIVGIKQVSINEPYFQGHFPGAPVMPGVLVVEALAQVGAVLALREIEDRDSKLVLFTGIREARFRRPVVPGDTLRLEVTALRIGSRGGDHSLLRRRDDHLRSRHGRPRSIANNAAHHDRRDERQDRSQPECYSEACSHAQHVCCSSAPRKTCETCARAGPDTPDLKSL